MVDTEKVDMCSPKCVGSKDILLSGVERVWADYCREGGGWAGNQKAKLKNLIFANYDDSYYQKENSVYKICLKWCKILNLDDKIWCYELISNVIF